MAERPHTFSKAGAKRIVDAVRRVESVQPIAFGGNNRGAKDTAVVWAKIMSSSSIGTGKWAYTVRLMVGGDASSHSGLAELSSTSYTAYNTAEKASVAGYVNTNVTSILAIPNGEEIPCTWSNRNGSVVLLFRDRNEPACD